MKAKELFLSVAIMVGAFACANANQNEVNSNVEATEVVETIVTDDLIQDEYKEIELEELSEKVQEAVNAFQEEYTVQSLAYNETKNQTKVTLISKADSSEKIVILNEEGEEITEAEETLEGEDVTE